MLVILLSDFTRSYRKGSSLSYIYTSVVLERHTDGLLYPSCAQEVQTRFHVKAAYVTNWLTYNKRKVGDKPKITDTTKPNFHHWFTYDLTRR